MPYPMAWQDLTVSEGRQQGRLPRLPPPLRPPPHRIPPRPHLWNIVRYLTHQDSTDWRTFLGLKFTPQILIDWLPHLLEH